MKRKFCPVLLLCGWFVALPSTLISCRSSNIKRHSLHTNALINEASPYLLQHAHNPVDWLPWGDAAFEKAREENKPIFLSIGYAACHWCHVMEHESFENDSIASLLNENFVSVKVDREERPDVDFHYMQAVQSMTGQGGWPLSVFLTTDGRPFFGGTYWPPEAKWGRPGFIDVLRSVSDAWANRSSEIESSAEEIQQALQRASLISKQNGTLGPDLLKKAVLGAQNDFDAANGGFGRAPKFPQPTLLALLLRLGASDGDSLALRMALTTLEKMYQGGIYDHLGGGFHRYSTDARWLVPHFEKMLYDNALLVPIYLDGWLITGNQEFRRAARETLDWALREMEVSEGGFASSLDADADGVEGKFYVWTPSEIDKALGKERGDRFCNIYDVTADGNFEGDHSILHLIESLSRTAERLHLSTKVLEDELRLDRTDLLAGRDRRIRPARDDKVLTDWNGLMISALVRGYAVLGDTRYLTSAQRTADHLLSPFEKSGRLVHSFFGTRTSEIPLLLDYASLGNGLLDLFTADGDYRWFDGTVGLTQRLDSLFTGESGAYTLSANHVAGLASIDPYDHALPSGISLAATLMAKLFYLTGDSQFEDRAFRQLSMLAGQMEQMPMAFSQGLFAVDLLLHPPDQLVLVGDKKRGLWSTAQKHLNPRRMTIWVGDDVATVPDKLSILLAGKSSIGGQPTAFLCHDFVCDAPVTSIDSLEHILSEATAEIRLP